MNSKKVNIRRYLAFLVPPAVGAMLSVSGVLVSALAAQSSDMSTQSPNPVIELLADGQVVFGIFSGDKTAERGGEVREQELTDFIFYSLESGPFDIATMRSYMEGMADADGTMSHPVLLRIPAITDEANARDQVAQGLAAGVSGIVFPHVARADQAAASVRITPGLWPGDPEGDVVSFLIVEDREGISNAREILATSGPSVVFAGPGDLEDAYDGDMEAVEGAIQTVLAACLEHDVPCGITAGVDDIARRIHQGFRVFIVTDEEALAPGRAAAGR